MSGDNPVFVESVKPGGAAQIAGLVAGDMILKVSYTQLAQIIHYQCILNVLTLLIFY